MDFLNTISGITEAVQMLTFVVGIGMVLIILVMLFKDSQLEQADEEKEGRDGI
jgi:hypothetical protein